MTNARLWIYRALTLGGIVLMVTSWLKPWWQAYIVELKVPAAFIRPWELQSFMPDQYAAWMVGAEMPPWFAPLMWAYFGLAVAALLISMFAPEKMIGPKWFRWSLPQWLMEGAAISYIVFVLVCVVVISIRASEFYGATLQGTINVAIDEHAKSDVTTSLMPGYWMAVATGPLLSALGFLRYKILGTAKGK